jgi:hypothetical protein
MKSVEIDPAIQADPALSELVRRATDVLKDAIEGSQWKDQVSASWTLLDPDTDLPNVRLRIEDDNDFIQTEFSRGELKSRDHVSMWMTRLWGDLLKRRTHKLLKDLAVGTAPEQRLDGDEALDRILDSLAEYSEREGHEPETIKLPVRYATALMKLGPSYWGEFYRQIRESGLGAFDGQTLLGMKVELVLGGNAELQVA